MSAAEHDADARGDRRRDPVGWVSVVVLSAAASGLLALVGFPSPPLLGAMFGGIGWSLLGPRSLTLPRAGMTAGQAVVGVSVGAYVDPETLSAIGTDLPAVLGANLVTLAFTVVAGLALARGTMLDRPTATFGMIAGGASGIVAIADRLGSDSRLVAVMQYLRVLVIIALTPLIAGLLPRGDAAGGGGDVAQVGAGHALLFVAVAAGVGLPLGRLARLPTGGILGPLFVAGALTAAGVPFAGAVPPPVLDIALGLIGIGVGLQFTPDSLRAAGRVLLPAALAVLALLVVCALAGLALAATTDRSVVDGYLATTPGGLFVVLAASASGGGDTTFVLANQVLRLLIVLLVAPLLARFLRQDGGGT